MKKILITFEGIDASGKTTQAKKLFNYLKRKKLPVIFTREPGGEKVAEKIRKILLSKKELSLTPLAEFLLYEACRSQIVTNLLLPALKQKKIVICDRFYDSTLAYQGYGRGLDLSLIKKLNLVASSNLVPDLTFFIDVPVKISLQRKTKLKTKKDRLEKEDQVFFEKVRKGYLDLAQKEKRVKVIDGQKSIPQIFEEIKKLVEQFLQKRV
jgi:dTMP kinase